MNGRLPQGAKVTLDRSLVVIQNVVHEKNDHFIRELQQNLKGVMALVERGQTIEITRRRRPIARLAPLPAAEPVSPWPDLDERTDTVFGHRIVAPGASAIVIENRGDR